MPKRISKHDTVRPGIDRDFWASDKPPKKPKEVKVFDAEIEADQAREFARGLLRLTYDPWILMLALGALGHELNIPYLFKFGFWQSFFIVLAVQAIWPIMSWPKFRIRKLK